MAEPLTADRLAHELRGLQGWAQTDGAIFRAFTFADPDQARDFRATAQDLIGARPGALELSEDPAEVQVTLGASADEGVTMEDIEVAHRLDALVGKT